MRKSRRLIATGAILLILALTVWLLVPHGPEIDPIRHGRHLSEWILENETNSHWTSDEIPRLEATKVLDEEGTNAVPLLLHMFQAHDTTLTSNFFRIIQKQRFINFRHRDPEILNRAAAASFRTPFTSEPPRYPFTPELVKIYERQYSPSSMVSVSRALASLGPSAQEAVPLLLNQISNTNGEIRKAAIWALGEIHANPNAVVPALIAKLNAKSGTDLFEVEYALGQYGTEAKAAIPYLVDMVRKNYSVPSPLPTKIPDNDEIGELIIEPGAYALHLIDPTTASNLMLELRGSSGSNQVLPTGSTP